jgi:23S rRNA G2069 N7-methylase RlmK/C1962 C5-methylase RlmI
MDALTGYKLTLDLYGQLAATQEAHAAAAARVAELEQRVEQLAAHNTELVTHLATFEGVEAPRG